MQRKCEHAPSWVRSSTVVVGDWPRLDQREAWLCCSLIRDVGGCRCSQSAPAAAGLDLSWFSLSWSADSRCYTHTIIFKLVNSHRFKSTASSRTVYIPALTQPLLIWLPSMHSVISSSFCVLRETFTVGLLRMNFTWWESHWAAWYVDSFQWTELQTTKENSETSLWHPWWTRLLNTMKRLCCGSNFVSLCPPGGNI